MSFYGASDVSFPHLGISIKNLPVGIDIFGFRIAFYGIIIALSLLIGFLIVDSRIKKLKKDEELYLELTFFVIVAAIVSARLYYVIFSWQEFADNPMQVFNFRTGGMAIYGGLLGAVLAAYGFCKAKKCSFAEIADIATPAVLLGQILGRLGNFFNKEAFGGYTDNLFAMRVSTEAISRDYSLSAFELLEKYSRQPIAAERIIKQLENSVIIDGIEYIQAHPTFLYEMAWNLILLIILEQCRKHKRFEGEIFALYLFGYGVGRTLIESLRTDSLYIFGTSLAASTVVSILLVLISGGYLMRRHRTLKKTRRMNGR